tara:strand:- start:2228 stop:2542 length:315 start_codon:yes stop_codon:yes gene_type:complete
MKVDHGIRVYVDDDMEEKSIKIMYNAIPYVNEIIEMKIKEGFNVLVHCMEGRQRSASIICGYLMLKKGVKYYDAVKYIREIKRDAFFGNVNFEKSLLKFEELII